MTGSAQSGETVVRPVPDFAALHPGYMAPQSVVAPLPFVIPGRAQREPGIHNHDREYGFRACAKWRIPE